MHRVVERALAHPEMLCGQQVVQLFKREMTVHAIYCIQNSIPFWSFPMLVGLQIVVQDASDFFLCVVSLKSSLVT